MFSGRLTVCHPRSTRLPRGDFYALDREVEPDVRELLTADAAGQEAVVFFTRLQAVERYLDGGLGEGWAITILSRKEVLQWLARVHRLGITRAIIDPGTPEAGPPVPIFRVLVDSEVETEPQTV